MEWKDLRPFAFVPVDFGYRGHILGAFKALSDLSGGPQETDELFVCFDEPVSLAASKFSSYKVFAAKVFELLDAYFQKLDCVPKVFISVYNPTESSTPAEDADRLCRAVKEYYAEKGFGFVFTAVLSSRFYKYKFADLINVPKHLLTFSSRIRMLRHKKFRKKILVTVGTINHFSVQQIKQKDKELSKKLVAVKNDEDLRPVVEKFEKYKAKKKHVVFCLGGRVESKDILFDVAYVQTLYAAAEQLCQYGYGVVFVNGPRTPNNVTEFLYEKTEKNPNILFQNSKKIAATDEERDPKNWRIYSGKYEEEFLKLSKIGNIYPAVLNEDNTLVVHTMDSYSACETAGVGIPTAVSTKGIWVDENVRYDCHNLVKLLCPKYAIDFDEFLKLAADFRIEPRNLRLSILPSSLQVFAETVHNRLNQMKKND